MNLFPSRRTAIAPSVKLPVLVASLLAVCAPAIAQGNHHLQDCPEHMAVPPAHLHGTWTLRWWAWDSQPETDAPLSEGTVTLFQHPEYAHSVRGHLERQDTAGRSASAALAGDLIDGVFKLDEAADGVHMSGVWEGAPVPGSCARSLMGTRWPAGENGEADDGDHAVRYQFRLDKVDTRR